MLFVLALWLLKVKESSDPVWNPWDSPKFAEPDLLWMFAKPEVIVFETGLTVSESAIVPLRMGSNESTAEPAPAVDETMPPVPEPAPPAPVVVPPAPPPCELVLPTPPPPGVPETRPVLTPRVELPDFARSTSVSAMLRL